jgi:hypothetical protein
MISVTPHTLAGPNIAINAGHIGLSSMATKT